MARIEESVDIKRPVDQVFAYVTDAKNWPRWESAMLEAEQTSPGQMGIGTTFRGANRVMGRRMVWISKVTEYEPNKKWGETISSGSTLIEDHLIFDPVEGGTKFTLVYDMQVGGLLKLFAPMVISTMRKQTKGNLSNLKSILEAQA
jgi:uncharacterized protein YndB with AHSA1/START domain